MYCFPRALAMDEGTGLSETDCVGKCEAKGLQSCNAISYSSDGRCWLYGNCQGTKVGTTHPVELHWIFKFYDTNTPIARSTSTPTRHGCAPSRELWPMAGRCPMRPKANLLLRIKRRAVQRGYRLCSTVSLLLLAFALWSLRSNVVQGVDRSWPRSTALRSRVFGRLWAGV